MIVTGIGTVLADDCRLTLRADALPLSEGDKARALAHAPARMVLDSRARTPLTARILEGDRRPLSRRSRRNRAIWEQRQRSASYLRMLKAGLH